MAETYNFPTHIRNTTFEGTDFEVVVNGAPLNLTNTVIRMPIADKIYSTTNGDFLITDATAGKFRLKKRIITLPAIENKYYISFTFPDGTVKIYIKGNWVITE